MSWAWAVLWPLIGIAAVIAAAGVIAALIRESIRDGDR